MPKTPFNSLTLCVLACIYAGCGGSTPNRKVSQTPQRDGTTLEPVSTKYADSRPSLSADATRLVFTSGRDGADAAPALKTYKAEWPVGGAPGAPARATTADLGFEREAVLSPDGAWIVITSSIGGRTDLHLVDYAGTLTPLRLTDDAAVESRVVFSPDSKLVGWIARDGTSEAAKAWLMEVGTGTDSALASRTIVSAEGVVARDLFFVPTGDATYALVTAMQSGSGNRVTYAKRTFAQLADAAAAQPTTLAEGVNYVADVAPFATADKIALAQRIIPATSKVAPAVTKLEELRLVVTSYVKTEPVFLSPAGGAPAVYAEPPGVDVVGAALSQDGATAFLLERNAWRCGEADAYQWGSSLALAPSTPPAERPAPIVREDGAEDPVKWDVVTERLLPRFVSAEAGFELVGDVCDVTRADGVKSYLDDKIQSFVLARNATATKYRMLYVTRFSSAFDEACRLKMGDTEIYAIDADGATRTVTAVSKNAAPIESTVRADGVVCGG